MIRALLALVALLAFAPAAHADSYPVPGSGLPKLGKPASGVKLVTPTGLGKLPKPTKATFAPGSTLTLDVNRRAPVTLRLQRITAQGRVLGTVKRARVRQGRFAVKLTNARAAYYRFHVGAGGFYAATMPPQMSVTPTPPAPAAPTAPAAPPAASPFPAPTGPPAAAMELDRTTVAPGQTLGVTLRNTGGTTLSHGVCHEGFERSTPGGWTAVTLEPAPCPAIAHLLHAGGAWQATIGVPADLAPGRYRVKWSLYPAATAPPQWINLTGEFDVG